MKIRAAFKLTLRRLLKISRRELPALFIYASTLAGALLIAAIAIDLTGIKPTAWPLLAISVSIINLPRAFNKDKNSKDPYLIRFARAFREGFIPMSSAMQNIQGLFDMVQALKKKIENAKQ